MAVITEAQFKRDLSGGEFDNLYCICGTEKMLVTHYTAKLVEKTAGKNPSDFNFHTFTDDFNVDDFAVALQVVPFTSEFNVVLVKDLDFSEFSSVDGDRIIELVSSAAGDSIVIFSYPTKQEVKPNAKDKKLKELIKKKGTLLEVNKLTGQALQKKLVSWAGKRDVTLTPQLASVIVEYSGTDLNTLRNELSKLCSYVGEGGVITQDNIDLLITKNLESSIFDLSKAVIAHDSVSAFKILDRLFYQREEPLSILAVLSSAYVDMYRVRIAIKCGSNSADVAQWFSYKGSPYRLRYAERDSKRTSTAVLRKSIDAIAQTDIAMKSTRTDSRVQLELLIVKLLMIANEDRRD